jgi:acyl dehydratase
MMNVDVGRMSTGRWRFSQEQFDRFAALSGDDNPIHVDAAFARRTRFGRPVAHGMLLYATICAFLSQHFPGAWQREQGLTFPAPPTRTKRSSPEPRSSRPGLARPGWSLP